MTEILLTSTADGVRTLSLNRPQRHNAFDDALYEALLGAVTDAVDDPAVRAILLRGEGRSFSSGRDTAELGQHGEAGRFAFLRRSQELNRRIVASPTPVIAALKGAVFGKALETALACDLRVAARGARLGFPEVGFGLVTDNGGAAQATILAGPSRAKLLLMTGEPVDVEQALLWGLVDILVGTDELDQRAFDLAASIAAKAPLAVAAAKELVDQHHRAAVANGGRTEMLAQLALFSTEDHLEAKAARREDRQPDLKGR